MAITVKTGTIVIPALFDVIEEESNVVPRLNIKSTPGEITVNFVSMASDTESPVKAVYEYGALSTADNIPLIFANRRLTERGVDTAIYLIIKHTDGYGVISGGVTADSGKPDRTVYVDKHLGSRIFDDSHYGTIHVEKPGKEGVPTIKRIV